MFVGSADLYRSLDAGNTWEGIGSYPHGVHPDIGAYSFVGNSNEMYLGTDGGVYHTQDVSAASIQWTNLNGLIATLRIYPGMSLHPSDPTIALGGTQDEGTIRYSGTPNWVSVGGCGDSASTAIDQTNPSLVYANCYYAAVERSTDGGNTFIDGAAGINTSDAMNFFPPLVADPSKSGTVYFGTTHVYQSTNAAVSWTSISPAFNPLWSIAVSPKDSSTVYAAEATAVWISTNAGAGTKATWIKGNIGLPPRQITQVVADPNTSTTAYVTVSGFSGFGDSMGHVFKTSDRGSTWVDISGNLPNIPADAIAIDPDRIDSLYLATDTGVFATEDGGKTWLPYGSGLPNVITTGIVFFHPTRLLRVSTFGRGMWSISAPAVSIGAPQVTVAGVVDSASYTTAIAPGELASVFGTNLTDGPTAEANSFPLPTLLAGATVLVNGAVVPMLYASPTQINFQMPSGVTAGTGSSFSVKNSVGSSPPVTITTLPHAPSMFQQNGNQALAENQDFSLNGAANGAAPGSYLIVYATGAGLVQNNPPDGQPAPLLPLAIVTAPVAATIDGVSTTVAFAGLTAGLAGVLQLNIQVPAGLAAGAYPLIVGIAGQNSTPAIVYVK